MGRKFTVLMLAMLVFRCLAGAAQKSWTGTVSDDKCAATKHDPACVEKCVAGGAKYQLVSKGKVYGLDAQDKFKGMGGKRVKVTGSLNGDTITVTSVQSK
jgi:hypothetical protein